MSTVKAANLQNTGSGAPAVKNSSGTEIGQFVKAWVTFNGRNTVAILDDFNVSSITDNGTGYYSVNFTNAFSNINYCRTGSATEDTTAADARGQVVVVGERSTPSASTNKIFTIDTDSPANPRDCSIIYCAFHGA